MLGRRKTFLSASAVTGSWVHWESGKVGLVIWGTWNGATAKLQMSPDKGTTAIDVDSASLTADGGVSLDLPSDVYLRVAISGAGGGTSLSAFATPAGGPA